MSPLTLWQEHPFLPPPALWWPNPFFWTTEDLPHRAAVRGGPKGEGKQVGCEHLGGQDPFPRLSRSVPPSLRSQCVEQLGPCPEPAHSSHLAPSPHAPCLFVPPSSAADRVLHPPGFPGNQPRLSRLPPFLVPLPSILILSLLAPSNFFINRSHLESGNDKQGFQPTPLEGPLPLNPKASTQCRRSVLVHLLAGGGGRLQKPE